jgi:hypothetical protein
MSRLERHLSHHLELLLYALWTPLLLSRLLLIIALTCETVVALWMALIKLLLILSFLLGVALATLIVVLLRLQVLIRIVLLITIWCRLCLALPWLLYNPSAT